MPDLTDSVLFLEDDEESHPEHFDRNLVSLIQQPGFSGVKAIGKDYRNVDPSIVTFNMSIYGSFKDSLGGWSNRRVGSYKPPYAS
jgi:hypothetical protein